MQKAWKRMPQWLRDMIMFIFIMGCAVGVCELLSACYDDNNPFATSVFILAVVLVSRFTTGYWPGILASAVGVVSVNYLFTYPFHEFNMSIDGYPLTFAVMLVVSILVSTLTTQIKRQEQLRYEAERDRMRANLLRSVSHDIRTPLTAIMGLSATVEENEALTDEGHGMVEEIHQNAQWLLHLSENILSVTRFCDEGVVIEKSDEVVEEIVGSAIRRFRKNCKTDIPITVSKPEEILLVPMDATLIEQVLLNLLENVAKHSPLATEIFIEIRKDARRVWLTVADNGDGIPPQLLGVLFDGYLPLGAVEASDRSRHMGIGLSVCRAIVRAHGGEIYARNRVGGGAEFRFTPPQGTPQTRENLGGMEVTTYTLHPDRTEEDLHYLRQAIALSRRCTPCATSYRVGAVIVTRSGDRFTGYTHETSPTHHAEQEAILKATAAGADLHGASIYSSMEPCSTRSSEPESCSELILRHGFSRTVFALYEPSCFVCCEGAVRLRKGGVEVRVYPQLAGEVLAINGHLGLHE